MIMPPPGGNRHLAFPMPDSTPAPNAYPNLVGAQGPTGATVKFSERKFRRTESSEENHAVCLQTLRDVWGYTSFREHQLDICMSAVRDRDIMMVAPTGLGKSLCFQLPALVLEYGLTIVVTPIKALMHDQILDLTNKGIDAMLACGDTSQEEFAAIKKQFEMGHPRKRIMYITPESLTGERSKWMPIIRTAYANGQLRRLVIDEAHCITEWGTTFRGSYRSLGEFRQAFPDIPISAFTASANKWTRSEIARTLGMDKTNFDMWVLPVNRSNIYYEVAYRSAGSNVIATYDYVSLWILRHVGDLRQRNIDNGIMSNTVTGIVYCRKVDECTTMANHLNRNGVRASAFYANMSVQKKATVLRQWKEGQLDCVCATIAFGMGIDQAHVRYVVHYNMPKSFEGFYQETGRAGRDGHVSRSLLIYSREDSVSVFNDLASDMNKLHREHAALQAKLDAAKGVDARGEVEADLADTVVRLKGMKRQFDSLEKLRDDLIENVGQCRHIAICKYFGEVIPHQDQGDGWRKAYCDKMCDVCTNRSAVARRFAFVNADVELPFQDAQEDDGDFTAFEDEGADPSSDMPDTATQSGSVAMGTLALMRSSSTHSSSPAPPGTSRSTGRLRTGGTPSASLLSLADAVHRPGPPKTAGLRRPHGRSRLGITSPIVPATALPNADDEEEATDREDVDASAGRKTMQLRSSSSRSLLGPTQTQRGRRGGKGIDLLSDPPESSDSANVDSSPPVMPTRTQMRTAAHAQARQRAGLARYSSNSDIEAPFSNIVTPEPPNLALKAKSRSKTSSPRVNAEAGPSRLTAASRGKPNSKRSSRDGHEGSDADFDTDTPSRKRATAPVSRLKALAGARAAESCTTDEESSTGGMDHLTGRRQPLSTMPVGQVSARHARLVAATSSADNPQNDKSSSPRPIPSVILPHNTAPTVPVATKNKGKGRAKDMNPRAASTAGAKLVKTKGKGKAVGSATYTMDSIAGPGEGSYALPAPPADTDVAKWRRKKQIEAFEGVEAVEGQGPYGYYNSTAPAAAAGSRTPRTPAQAVRGSATPRSTGPRSIGQTSRTAATARAATQGYKTPFRTPFSRPQEKGRMGPILADTRKETLGKIQEALFKHSDCAVWDYWGIGDLERHKGIKKVARSVEHELALSRYTSTDYVAGLQVLLKCIKLLGVSDVVYAVCNNELAGDFGHGETGAMMRLVERFAKQHGVGHA